jgi:hypothetical protein
VGFHSIWWEERELTIKSGGTLNVNGIVRGESFEIYPNNSARIIVEPDAILHSGGKDWEPGIYTWDGNDFDWEPFPD